MEQLRQKYGWKQLTLLDKGWSKDQKYEVIGANDEKLLLRISAIETYSEKEKQFQHLQQLAALGVNAPKPVAIGKLDETSLYFVLTWIEGVEASLILPTLSQKEQYQLGRKAGEILTKIHQLPIIPPTATWSEFYVNKTRRKLARIESGYYAIPHQDELVRYINANMHRVVHRPWCWQHGDYHVGNMVIHQGELGIIDFDKQSVSDPYDELKPFVWNVWVSPDFQVGLIHGYFQDAIPDDFFPILALYAADSLLSYFIWAATFDQKELETGYKLAHALLDWFQHFTITKPTWYYDPKIKEG